MRELRCTLDDQKAEVKRVHLEAASLAKQHEQALQRLRREADAGGGTLLAVTVRLHRALWGTVFHVLVRL